MNQLISCPACGKSVSQHAKTCPNCGHPISDDINNVQPIYVIENNDEQLKKEYVLNKYIIHPIIKIAIVFFFYYLIRMIYLHFAENPTPQDIMYKPFFYEAVIYGFYILNRNLIIFEINLIFLLLNLFISIILGVIILPLYVIWNGLLLIYGLSLLILGNRNKFANALGKFFRNMNLLYNKIRNKFRKKNN